MKWDEMKYWTSGEWQVVQERLDDMKTRSEMFCPRRELLFAALDAVPFDQVKVCILGQDPYPDPKYPTGLAFSVEGEDIPQTLDMIFREYCSDLGLPRPRTGSLRKWCQQGVLLWNCIPSCSAFRSLSHRWTEWDYLTREILQTLSQETSVVFAALGSIPRQYAHAYISPDDSTVVVTSHPSPRGNMRSKTPFLGSRLFSTINVKLIENNMEPIDWRL